MRAPMLCAALGMAAGGRVGGCIAGATSDASTSAAESGAPPPSTSCSDRDRARTAGSSKFHEIYVKADLSVCEGRDPKGLYKRARRGEIADFTGISAPYEEPDGPELVLDTSAASADDSLKTLLDYVKRNFRVRD